MQDIRSEHIEYNPEHTEHTCFHNSNSMQQGTDGRGSDHGSWEPFVEWHHPCLHAETQHQGYEEKLYHLF